MFLPKLNRTLQKLHGSFYDIIGINVILNCKQVLNCMEFRLHRPNVHCKWPKAFRRVRVIVSVSYASSMDKNVSRVSLASIVVLTVNDCVVVYNDYDVFFI
jgi:hypothetical protein